MYKDKVAFVKEIVSWVRDFDLCNSNNSNNNNNNDDGDDNNDNNINNENYFIIYNILLNNKAMIMTVFLPPRRNTCNCDLIYE